MRNEFPIFAAHPNLIYLDTAATAHKPQCVIDALTRFYTQDYATVHRAIYQSSLRATDHYNASRQAAAVFLHAKHPEEIIFTRGTTDALNLVAHSFAPTVLQPHDEILLSEMEHHSNIVPWQMIAEKTGAKLRWIPMDAQGVLEWKGTITARTKIVTLAHVSNVTGTINPIKEIAKEARRVGAKIIVDGAQAAPCMPVDVQDLDCDFYAFSGHKCYGPTGIGVLYGKKELLEQMPPLQGGGDMIIRVDREKTTYQNAPLRFEAGTPSIASVVALKSALEFVTKHRTAPSLLHYATQQLQEIPHLQILGTAKEKTSIITFHIPGVHPLDIASFLDVQNIAIRSGHLCAQPALRAFGLEAAARLSLGIYNTKSDIDRCLEALHNAIAVLA